MPSQSTSSFYRSWLKPIADVIAAAVGLILSSPIMLLVSMVLLIVNKGRVLFIQQRIGWKERVFDVIKFKTMNDDRGPDGALKSDEERLTTVGRFVRRTSLDELPQLFNILRGDMSFVGPRPLLPEYLPYYSVEHRRRHEVKPGITGLAQVNGRNAISWEKRLAWDVTYVDNQSFLLDFRILLKTILKVLKSEGISAEGHATMPKFSDYMKRRTAE